MLNEKNILFIVTGIKIGGLETYLLRFLKSKKNKINPIILVQSLDKDDLFYEDFIKLGVKIVYLPIKFSPLSFSKFFSILKREKINCVCDFRGDFSGISLLFSSLANGVSKAKNLLMKMVHFIIKNIKSIYIKRTSMNLVNP